MGKNEVEMELMIQQGIAALTEEYQSLSCPPEVSPAPIKEIMLPMSDGVSLQTICHRPEGKGPFPTIVMRSSYPFLQRLHHIHAVEYSTRGFAFIYQFCRGQGKSEGKWEPNINDRQDGKETLDWLASQEWVKNIGYWGSSYLAFTGWIIADIVPDKVKTLYLTHYGTDRFASAYQNGLFRQDVLTAWAMGNAGFLIEAEYFESLKYRPQVNVDEDLWGQKLDWYRDWITNTNRRDAYWNEGFWEQLREIPGKLKLPVYIGEGWYDHHLGSALNTFISLSSESKKHSTFRIGAWNHNFEPCLEGKECHDLRNSDVRSAFSWFNTILKKEEEPEGKVLAYEIGSDSWKESQTYPFSNTNQRTFYLSAEEALPKASSLIDQVEKNTSSLSYVYDPDNPVYSHGAESTLYSIEEIGSLKQPDCGWREDVISFISKSIEHDLHILGRIQVKLYVSSTADDTAFSAKLMEVHPDGSAYNIRSGITTLGYRAGADVQRMEYIPGEIVEAEIDMWDISWNLKKNSRLRLDITSSDFPQYAIHTNYAGIWALQKKARKAEQTLYFSEKFPSQIMIPTTK